MTWGQFKRAVEKQGVKDEDDIWYIDVSFSPPFQIEEHKDLGKAISN